MTVEEFLLEMMRDLKIRAMDNDYHFEESGSCHILLDRGTKYCDLRDDNFDPHVESIVARDYEEFTQKYGYLEFAVKKYMVDRGLDGGCYFTHDTDKGYFYLDLNVIFNTGEIPVFGMTDDEITELINTKVRPSDGFKFNFKLNQKGKNSLQGSVDLIVNGRNHGRITVIHIERHAEEELVLVGFGSMVRFSKYNEIKNKLINLGDHLAFKASEYLKNSEVF